MPFALEREIKLRFDSASTARQAILSIGATLLRARRLQQDYLLDTLAGQLRQQLLILRVRVEPGGGSVTLKGPGQSSTMKLREEIETPIGDAAAFLCILEKAGFSVWFRYEKYREEFTAADVVIALDETPVGVFVELEGSEIGVMAVADALGRNPSDYVLDSYRGLFAQYCAERSLPVTDMLFDRS